MSKKAPFQVIDNFLPSEYFAQLKEAIEGNAMPWFFINGVARPDDLVDAYFMHTFYNDCTVNSDLYPLIRPIVDKLNCKAVIRAKANLYTQKPKLIEHAKHTDFPYSHKAFILYINTNDGFTRMHDGTKIESVANRGLFFDGSKEHNSTNCTDAHKRINISINYF